MSNKVEATYHGSEYTTEPPRSPYMCSCGSTVTHHSHGERVVEPERIVVQS